MIFGQRVAANAVLKRYWKGGDKKEWSTVTAKEREGIFLGYRNLSDGEVSISYEGFHQYKPMTYLKAALVVFSEHENPVYVPLDDIWTI